MATAAGAALFALGRGIFEATVKYDSLERALTTVAGSSEAAEKQLVRLREVAKVPGLGFAEAIQGSVRLQAAGLSARQAEAALYGFGNALATVGKGKESLDFVTLALSQMAAKGRVMGDDLRQLSEQVPQIRQVMLSAFGTADQEILQKAGISSKQFIDIVNRSLELLPRMGDSLKNNLDNAADSVEQSMARMGKAMTPILNQLLKFSVPIVEFAGKLTTGVVNAGDKQDVIANAFINRKPSADVSISQQAQILKNLEARIIKSGSPMSDFLPDGLMPPASNADMWSNLQKRIAEVNKELRVSAELEAEVARKRGTLGRETSGILLDAKAMAKAFEVANDAIKNVSSADNVAQLSKLSQAARTAIDRTSQSARPDLNASLQEQIKDATAKINEKQAEDWQKHTERMVEINKKLDKAIFDSTHDRFAKEANEIRLQAAEYLKAGMNRLKVETFLSAELHKIHKEQTDFIIKQAEQHHKKAIEQAEKTAKRVIALTREIGMNLADFATFGAVSAWKSVDETSRTKTEKLIHVLDEQRVKTMLPCGHG